MDHYRLNAHAYDGVAQDGPIIWEWTVVGVWEDHGAPRCLTRVVCCHRRTSEPVEIFERCHSTTRRAGAGGRPDDLLLEQRIHPLHSDVMRVFSPANVLKPSNILKLSGSTVDLE
ncbi:hypothetical protein BDZ89DRAFT_601806 [Hymenopellis radicata]|nr:hypothetical protein BDZ89DRAFT_601806 [Hymenopellis radicata]